MTHTDNKPSAFVLDAAERLKKEIPENELWEKFKDKNQYTFDDFLYTEALGLLYEQNPFLGTKISDLPLSFRSRNALDGWIYDVGELIQYSEKGLQSFRRLGSKSLNEI